MVANADNKEVEFYAHELDGDLILGHGYNNCPVEAFDAVREAVPELTAFSDGDRVAVVEFDSGTDEISDITVDLEMNEK